MAREIRRWRHFPKHSPPHWDLAGEHQYLITAACFEHRPFIGKDTKRMAECEERVLAAVRDSVIEIYAWCILPNHYHLLLKTEHVGELRHKLGLFHGRSSFDWNGEDSERGRQVWYNCFERAMKSERHFWASLNYVHHNAVYHGCVDRWQDWPWSSAAAFLQSVGREEAEKIWKEYPIKNYGKKWDV